MFAFVILYDFVFCGLESSSFMRQLAKMYLFFCLYDRIYDVYTFCMIDFDNGQRVR